MKGCDKDRSSLGGKCRDRAGAFGTQSFQLSHCHDSSETDLTTTPQKMLKSIEICISSSGRHVIEAFKSQLHQSEGAEPAGRAARRLPGT